MRLGNARTILPDADAVRRGMLELTLDPHCAVDASGALRYVNPALAEALGSTPMALLGTPFTEYLAPADRDGAWRCLERARQEPGPVAWEARSTGPHGETIVAWRARLQPETGLVLVIGRNVTDVRKSEEDLRANQRLLRAVFDTIPHSLVAKDRDSNLLMGNAAWSRRFGYRPEELVGRNTMEIETRPEADRAKALALDRTVLHGDQDLVENEFERTALDGSLRMFHNWRSRLRDHSGRVIGLVSMSQDVTESRQAREALLDSERRFRNLIEGSIQGIVILRGRKPVFANESYARMFGYERAEEIVALESVDGLVAPQDLQRQTEYGQMRMRGEPAPSEYEFEGIRRDGARIWLDCLVKTVQWEGAPAVQCALLDITERKRAEERLRANERLLQTVFDTVPHLLFVKDRDSNYLMVNSVWLERYGRGPEAMVGLNTLALQNRPWEDRQDALARDQAVLRAGRMLEMEFDRTAADGTRRHYRNFRAPLRDETGAVVGIVGIAEDVTERKRAEDAARASQRLLRLMVDALPHNIFVKDLQGRFVMANRAMAACHGLVPEQVVGHRLEDLPGPTPDERAALRRTDEEVLAHGTMMEWPEVRLTTADGAKRIHRLQKMLLRGDDGEAQGIVCVSEDITEHRKAEEAARASQRLLRLVVDALPHNIHVKDPQRRYVMTNRAMAAFHALAPDEIVGLTTADLPGLQRQEREAIEDADRQVLETGCMLDLPDVPITDGSGRITYQHMHKLPLRDDDGRIQGLVGISVDVTERRQAEQELRASQRLLQTVIDTMPILITVKDPGRRYVMVNKAWTKHFGIPADQALNHSLRELAVRAGEEVDTVDRMDDAILRGGQAHWEEPLLRTLPDGSHQHFLTYRAPLHDEAGRVRGVVGAVMDVTPLKRVEEELRVSRQLLQTVFDLIPMWVFVKDRDRRLVMVNKRLAEDHGVTPEEAVRGRPYFVSDRLTPEQIATYEAVDRRVLEMGQQVEVASNPSTLNDGNIRMLRTIRVPLRNDQGQMVGLVGISEDVTERERAQRAVQQAQKLESLGVLAGGIAHDFNNLLVSVLGYAHLVATELPPDSPVQPLVRQIETAGRRAGDLCTQMLAYAGKGSFQVSQVQLNGLIREMTELIRVSLSRNIRLQFDFDEDLPELEVDATQLRQVVMNLVINASEAIAERPGAITVRTGVREVDAELLSQFVADPNLAPGRYVCLEVADTGSGMDAETLQRIFDPFFTTKFSGRGLGLAAVLGIVRGHHGALRVASTSGAGTTFTVLLPLGRPSPEGDALLHVAEAHARGSGAVLVADDEFAVRDLVQRVLESRGYDVTTVTDAESALEAVPALGEALRAVFLDVTMPGLNTKEALLRLRDEGVCAPVIVMSGHAESDVRERMAGLTVAGYLKKPFTGDDVWVLLERVLSAARQAG